MEFRTEPSLTGSLDRVTAAMPELDLPCVVTDWLLWLPRGYRLVDVTGGTVPTGTGGFTWSQRLLGPFGRAADEYRWDVRPRTVIPATERLIPAPDGVVQSQTSFAEFGDSTSPEPLIADDGVLVRYTIRASGRDPIIVRTMLVPTANAWGAVVSVLVLAMCLCWVRKGGHLPRFVALAAALTLIVPDPLAPLATGALWGILLALIAQALWHATRPVAVRPVAHSGVSSIRRLPVASGASVTILVMAHAWACWGAEPPAPDARDEVPDEIYRVFIPVDDQEQPTGDKYQVPEGFFDELQRRAVGSGGSTSGLLIRSARYALSINREVASDAFLASDVSAQYEILVMRPNTALRLPTTAVRPGIGARRDGRKVELEWDTDEDGFTCRFDEPGVYHLDLFLRPQRGEGPGSSLDIAIPAVPHATLEVRLPAAPPNIDVLSAVGEVGVSADGRKLTAELGPAERLSLRWARRGKFAPPVPWGTRTCGCGCKCSRLR